MRAALPISFLALFFAAASCHTDTAAFRAGSEGTDAVPRPPVAAAKPKRLEIHGDVRVDDYYWLRERESEKVIEYLEAENDYTKAMLAHTEELQAKLYEEMVGRVRQDDSTVPARDGDYLYYTRYDEGKQYPYHCRTPVSDPDAEEILLDVSKMAEGHGFYSVGNVTVSPGQQKLAYAVDTQGRRINTIEVKDLATGEVLDRIPEVTGNCAWAADDETLFYGKQDPETLRSYQIWRHVLGEEEDTLVYEETDETFSCWVWRTQSREYVVIGSSQTLSNEYRILRADDPMGEFRLFHPREREHEYRIGHHGDHFYVLTNKDAENFRLMRTPVDATAPENWEEVVPHRPDVLLEDFELFRDYLVLSERKGGLVHLFVRPFSGAPGYELEFPDPAYSVWPRDNREFDSTTLRFNYSSLTTPSSVYDYDMGTRERKLMKRQEILGGFDPEEYRSERLFATADDGTRVPISLVYRLPFEKDGSRPLLLYAYGSYGASMDARFDPNALSLIDRGFVYAIAHIRGGQEMGRSWYEDGKLLKKKNTFTDFIACGEHLVAEGYTRPERLLAMGGSAGGLLIGAVVNMRPDLFHGVVAAVPFVDVVTTMLDESIPLTTFEFDEWGNPKDPVYYEYMLSYSPYDQVAAKDYPHILVTTGLHDSQVQYWEPAKWVAKLRATKTDANRLLMKTEMEAGHGGVSGRYSQYKDRALMYAFLIDLVQG